MAALKHLRSSKFFFRISTVLLVPCGILSYHIRQSFKPSVLPNYSPPSDVELEKLMEDMNEHMSFFPPIRNPSFTQYFPRRTDNGWATRYAEAKNMWWWWDRVYHWVFIWSAAGYLLAALHLLLLKRAMRWSPIGVTSTMCVIGVLGLLQADLRESFYRGGLVKELYERAKQEDEEGRQPTQDALDEMTDVGVDTSGNGTYWPESSDERERLRKLERHRD
jgi:hypothetical protein